jgi:hypothetical protein
MKKKPTLLMALWIVSVISVVCLFGCHSDDNKPEEVDFLTKLQSLELINTPENGFFSEWALKKIEEIETSHVKDISIVKVRIFKGEWNNRNVYFISDNLQSCLFCEVYYDDGIKIEWSAEDLFMNFCKTSKGWKLIYEFGEGIY